MIVETIDSPSALRLHYFNHHLDNVENILRRIEAYGVELNNHICGTKKLVATNQNLIDRLQENEQNMKFLLEDKQGQKLQSTKKRCHLRRTCKVTNIREICWTQCRSFKTQKEEKRQDWVEIHKESHALLNSLKNNLDRQKGGQDVIPFPDQNQEIIFKVSLK
ncbi:uncharacterized protein [Drosophila takahashii]|uniref:uncharacterized protein isoform X2 n=1 Tax=Drosophila takahashii TaxID=29030 RepID=UPI0038996A2A